MDVPHKLPQSTAGSDSDKERQNKNVCGKCFTTEQRCSTQLQKTGACLCFLLGWRAHNRNYRRGNRFKTASSEDCSCMFLIICGSIIVLGVISRVHPHQSKTLLYYYNSSDYFLPSYRRSTTVTILISLRGSKGWYNLNYH